MKQPAFTIRDLIDLWPRRRVLADDINVNPERVYKWVASGSIPARYHLDVIEAAQRRGMAISADLLVHLHSRCPSMSVEDVMGIVSAADQSCASGVQNGSQLERADLPCDG